MQDENNSKTTRMARLDKHVLSGFFFAGITHGIGYFYEELYFPISLED